MKNRRNCYRILRVQPDAESEIIRASYHTLMRELGTHPDLGGEHLEALLLNEAYAVLGDPEKRAQYDRQLLKHYTVNPKKGKDSHKKPLTTVACPYCRQSVDRDKVDDNISCPSCRSDLSAEDRERTLDACRREINRMKKEQAIWYYLRSPHHKRAATMIDFSPQGLRFKCKEFIKPKTLIHVSAAFFSAIAEVKSVQALASDGVERFAIGVRFESLNIIGRKGLLLSASV